MIASPFHGKDFAHPSDSGLGDRIKRSTDALVTEGANAADVDHPAWHLCFDQATGDFTRENVGAPQVGIEDTVNQIQRHLVCPLRIRDTGIIDQNIDRASNRFCVFDGGHDAVGIGHIEATRICRASLFSYNGFEFGQAFLATASGNHGGTSRGKDLREAPAQPRGCASNQCHPARQIGRNIRKRVISHRPNIRGAAFPRPNFTWIIL